MKTLAMCTNHPDLLARAPEPHTGEAARVWALYHAGVVREMYFRADGAGAVLVLETATRDEAAAAVHSLPLVQAGLLDVQLIELTPFAGLASLFAPGAAAEDAL